MVHIGTIFDSVKNSLSSFVFEYVAESNPAPRPASTAGTPSTADTLSSGILLNSANFIWSGEKDTISTFIAPDKTIGAPLFLPPNFCLYISAIASASSLVGPPIWSSLGERITPGTAILCNKAAVYCPAASSPAISLRTPLSGARPRLMLFGSTF